MDCAALYKREIRLERLEIIELRSDLIQKAEFRTFINYPNLWVSLLSIPDYRNLIQKAISVLVRLPTRGIKRLYGARVKKTNSAPPWSKFGAPMIESEFFRRQICCIEESTCDIAGTFRRLQQ